MPLDQSAKNMKLHKHLLCFALFCSTFAAAQPANDECDNAIHLNNVTNYCSATAEFTIEQATESNPNNPSCWPQFSTGNDVWFSFTAQATQVNISVSGNTGGPGSGGSLLNPQFALYEGSCSGILTEIQCASDGFDFNVAESLAGPLNLGQKYYIRVAARNNNVGTFKLCVNNFNEIPDPSSDCKSGVVLCDKSPFNVESVVGTGNETNEIINGSCINEEHGSAWYKWTCDEPGSLTFTLTPNNPSDDLDFILFELPNGLDDCDNKIELRCMASGEQVGAPFSVWQPCTGATGLSEAATDVAEFPGCQAGDDNFVSAIQMEAGKSYALIVDNFSNTGSGFAVEFGGTGTFLGPEADFIPEFDRICEDVPLTITDNSTAVSGIQKWEWHFGDGASPATAVGEGPHTVSYSTPGTKSILLQLTSMAGCVITHIEEIEVTPAPEVSIETSADYCDPGVSSGDIFVLLEEAVPPVEYEWNNSGVFVSDSFLLDQPAGNYTVTVRDSFGCETPLDFVLLEGLALQPGSTPVQPPTCNGDTDGSITVNIEIANDPVTYDWGSGPQPDNTLSGIGAGLYSVTVTDATGCSGTFNFDVEDFPVLEPNLDAVDISCFGEQDGSIIAEPVGGAGNYTFLWSNNSTKEGIFNLPEGIYTLTLTDGNGCAVISSAEIVEPPDLVLDLVEIGDVVCFGDTTGFISVAGSGGTPPLEYSIGGQDFQPDPTLNGLSGGTYSVVVQDARGCRDSLSATINTPPPLIVEAGDDQTVELGYTVNLHAVHTPPFHPVTWSWTPPENLNCPDCDDPVARPVETTQYVITIEDEAGCRSEDSLTVFVVKNYPVYVPNAFSPNNDGTNDRFTLFGGPAVEQIRSLKIFSRWGSMVFEGYNLQINNPAQGWDGTFNGQKMNPAVFAYVAEVAFIDGEVIVFKGDVTLVR
ncbi:MAG: hypothetical protein D6714_07665 [Bacteroidetes bacterium]|nr:MAG: hypothetical protein D6714_07665 [Bacteroidota bacterium]